MSLSYIGQQLTIYVGLFILVTGIVGNGINIFIFSTVRIYRTTPSSFYFLVGSIVNIMYILISLTSRIVNAIYGYNLNDYSLIWCKARPFLISVFSLVSFTCSCLATIDQFFVTSQSVRLRRYSKIQGAYRIVFLVVIVWCLHGIPTCFYNNIPPPGKTCVYTNDIYRVYVSIYALVLICAIPVLVMVIFGWLAYQNIRQTLILAGQHADRQLVKMTLIQVIVVVISITPYGIMNSYNLITSGVTKSMDRQMKESFVSTVLGLTFYFYYIGNFYMFLISSNRFRQTVKDRIFPWLRTNQIRPH